MVEVFLEGYSFFISVNEALEHYFLRGLKYEEIRQMLLRYHDEDISYVVCPHFM